MMVKDRAEAVPPPGVGLKTVTLTFPAAATLLASTLAVSWALLTKVVARSVLPQRMTEVGTNPLPFTVRVNLLKPAVT